MESLKERAKKDFIRNQKKIEDKKTSKEERKYLIRVNQFILDYLNNNLYNEKKD